MTFDLEKLNAENEAFEKKRKESVRRRLNFSDPPACNCRQLDELAVAREQSLKIWRDEKLWIESFGYIQGPGGYTPRDSALEGVIGRARQRSKEAFDRLLKKEAWIRATMRRIPRFPPPEPRLVDPDKPEKGYRVAPIVPASPYVMPEIDWTTGRVPLSIRASVQPLRWPVTSGGWRRPLHGYDIWMHSNGVQELANGELVHRSYSEANANWREYDRRMLAYKKEQQRIRHRSVTKPEKPRVADCGSIFNIRSYGIETVQAAEKLLEDLDIVWGKIAGSHLINFAQRQVEKTVVIATGRINHATGLGQLAHLTAKYPGVLEVRREFDLRRILDPVDAPDLSLIWKIIEGRLSPLGDPDRVPEVYSPRGVALGREMAQQYGKTPACR